MTLIYAVVRWLLDYSENVVFERLNANKYGLKQQNIPLK